MPKQTHIICLLFFILSGLFYSCKTEDKSYSRNKTAIIALQPFAGFETELLDSIAVAIQEAYTVTVCVLPEIPLPQEAFVNIKSPRYRADSLLKYLKKIKPDSIDYIIGLTRADISTTKRDGNKQIKQPESKYADWGVMGLGYMPGRSCVVSTYRLKNRNRKLFVERLQKVSVHELGHNFGLPHCHTPTCVMQDAAESIKTIDNVGFAPCDLCRQKLH
jgi:archaemetzincin